MICQSYVPGVAQAFCVSESFEFVRRQYMGKQNSNPQLMFISLMNETCFPSLLVTIERNGVRAECDE